MNIGPYHCWPCVMIIFGNEFPFRVSKPLSSVFTFLNAGHWTQLANGSFHYAKIKYSHVQFRPNKVMAMGHGQNSRIP